MNDIKKINDIVTEIKLLDIVKLNYLVVKTKHLKLQLIINLVQTIICSKGRRHPGGFLKYFSHKISMILILKTKIIS